MIANKILSAVDLVQMHLIERDCNLGSSCSVLDIFPRGVSLF